MKSERRIRTEAKLFYKQYFSDRQKNYAHAALENLKHKNNGNGKK